MNQNNSYKIVIKTKEKVWWHLVCNHICQIMLVFEFLVGIVVWQFLFWHVLVNVLRPDCDVNTLCHNDINNTGYRHHYLYFVIQLHLNLSLYMYIYTIIIICVPSSPHVGLVSGCNILTQTLEVNIQQVLDAPAIISVSWTSTEWKRQKSWRAACSTAVWWNCLWKDASLCQWLHRAGHRWSQSLSPGVSERQENLLTFILNFF